MPDAFRSINTKLMWWRMRHVSICSCGLLATKQVRIEYDYNLHRISEDFFSLVRQLTMTRQIMIFEANTTLSSLHLFICISSSSFWFLFYSAVDDDYNVSSLQHDLIYLLKLGDNLKPAFIFFPLCIHKNDVFFSDCVCVQWKCDSAISLVCCFLLISFCFASDIMFQKSAVFTNNINMSESTSFER